MKDRKVNATGRSMGQIQGRRGRIRRPPKGEPWTWLLRELLCSPSWQAMSINARRLMDFLLVEHTNHAGLENGHLAATYDQLVQWGLTRSEIPSAIRELEDLGLVECEHGGRWRFTNQPSRFRLTFYVDRFDNPASNAWKRVDEAQVKELRRRRQKQKSMSKSRTTVVRKVALRAIDGGKSQ